MVELLISSDIAKYCEFKTVTRVLTVIDGNVEKVNIKNIYVGVSIFILSIQTEMPEQTSTSAF